MCFIDAPDRPEDAINPGNLRHLGRPCRTRGHLISFLCSWRVSCSTRSFVLHMIRDADDVVQTSVSASVTTRGKS